MPSTTEELIKEHKREMEDVQKPKPKKVLILDSCSRVQLVTAHDSGGMR